MKTIKLPYKTNEDLTSILKQYSSVVRYSYNRFLDGKTEKDIRELTKSLNNIDLLNSWKAAPSIASQSPSSQALRRCGGAAISCATY